MAHSVQIIKQQMPPGTDNQIIWTPSLVYRLKNGLSFGITGYNLTNDSVKEAGALSNRFNQWLRMITMAKNCMQDFLIHAL